MIALRAFAYESQSAANGLVILIVLYPLWLLITWVSLFYFWTDYYLDILIISNKRIIDIEQQGMFYREISSFPLENIQDITIDIPGIVATFLDFGNVKLQTASEKSNFIIPNAAHPEIVKQTIQDAHDKALETLRSNTI